MREEEKKNQSILILTREQEIVSAIRSCFNIKSAVHSVSNRQAAIDMLHHSRYDFIFIDLVILKDSNGEGGYREFLQPFGHLYPSVEIIIMSSKEMIREAVRAVKLGASDYITYPVDPEEVRYVTDSLQEHQIVQSELDYLRDKFWETDSAEHIYSVNPQMKKLYKKFQAVAPTRSTVLLAGETGTGKSLLAKLIHRHSSRSTSQFISVHCGAIPDTLLESELFGHEKGAFTGAIRRKLGKFEIAHGGTIFLDEIGTITPSAQIKLLQVLQDGTFQRVGGDIVIEADVRVIAATNVDLKAMCEDGSFRKDLYYRLNVFPIEIPPLKERIEDIPNLIEGFIKKMNKLNNKDIIKIDSQVLPALLNYSWPGNIRELENIIERAYILETSYMLTPESFPSEIFDTGIPIMSTPVDASLTLAQARNKGIENIERSYIKEVLAKSGGSIKDSAYTAGITTRHLHKLMTKYGIRKEEFKPSSYHRRNFHESRME
ncbi:MAG: sigma-54-dependent Fis family transcriptional regulator [Deltaproteobacteria bacterium]|nr:sigma-54-dependent Fis family transcriptional regulator [Deltaproteobacteria bacterium]